MDSAIEVEEEVERRLKKTKILSNKFLIAIFCMRAFHSHSAIGNLLAPPPRPIDVTNECARRLVFGEAARSRLPNM